MEEQNQTNQNLEQESQIQEDYNPVSQEQLIINKKSHKAVIIIIIILTLVGLGFIFYPKKSGGNFSNPNFNGLQSYEYSCFGFKGRLIFDGLAHYEEFCFGIPYGERRCYGIENNDEAKQKKQLSCDSSSFDEEIDSVNNQQNLSQGIEPFVISNAGQEIIISNNNVDIFESYSGAAWSEDSEKVYFMKYVEIDLTYDLKNQLEEDYFDMVTEEILNSDFSLITSTSTENLDDIILTQKYDDYWQPLKELQFFEYDIINNKISFLTSMEYNPWGYPVIIFIDSYIQDNSMIFGSNQIIYKLNLTNKKITSRPGPSPSSDHTVQIDGDIFGPTRYISPNSHAYFEVPERKSSFDYTSDDELKYFYDLSIRLISSERSHNPDNNLFFAGYIINDQENILDIKLLRSPEEIEFRKKVGLAKFDDK